MKTSIPTALLHTALLSLVSATAAADPAVILYPKTAPAMAASLKACAIAAANDSHAAHLDVVRYIEHAGRGSYEYWINTTEPMKAGIYCRTRRDGIAEFRSVSGNWTGTRPARPKEVDKIASSSAELCRTDYVAPSNVAASLNSPAR